MDSDRPRLRPLQVACLLGGALSLAVAFFAFDDVSPQVGALGIGLIGLLPLDALWRGLTTGALPYRMGSIERSEEPVMFAAMLVFYLFTFLGLLYFCFDLLVEQA